MKLNNSLGGFTPIIDSTGKITGYKTKAGADTVFPFKSAEIQTMTFTGISKTIEFDEPPSMFVVYNNTNKGISAFYGAINDVQGGYGTSLTKNTDTNFTFKDNSGMSGDQTVLYV